MPVNIVCDGCGRELRPLLWRRGVDAGISVSGAGVTFASIRDGTIMVARSDPCRGYITIGQTETFAS
jgi:hypothetical protein